MDSSPRRATYRMEETTALDELAKRALQTEELQKLKVDEEQPKVDGEQPQPEGQATRPRGLGEWELDFDFHQVQRGIRIAELSHKLAEKDSALQQAQGRISELEAQLASPKEASQDDAMHAAQIAQDALQQAQGRIGELEAQLARRAGLRDKGKPQRQQASVMPTTLEAQWPMPLQNSTQQGLESYRTNRKDIEADATAVPEETRQEPSEDELIPLENIQRNEKQKKADSGPELFVAYVATIHPKLKMSVVGDLVRVDIIDESALKLFRGVFLDQTTHLGELVRQTNAYRERVGPWESYPWARRNTWHRGNQTDNPRPAKTSRIEYAA